MEQQFHDNLKFKMDALAHLVYEMTRDFPREETYGVTSQLRRSALSVVLNYIEGYARRKPAVQLNFYEISYGSAQEVKYLLEFCREEKYISIEDFNIGNKLINEISAMLWTEISHLSKKLSE